ncbi:MAG: hypothetical protein ACFB0C_00640 [Leptolyngbyaceae cyanobacterium]
MARYTTLFKAASPLDNLRQMLADTLASCELDLIYQNDEYLVAKERPGGVKPARLATVEVLISPPTIAEPAAKVNLVVKNEELALKQNNHCQKIFELVHSAISNNSL